MLEAGISTKHKPHSLQSVASTKAAQQDNRAAAVKQPANWSKKSDAFDRY